MPGMDPQWIIALIAGLTLLILWTTTVIGGAIWLMKQFKNLKEEILREILGDFNEKHGDNERTVKAMEALVMRHDLILEPEFNGSGRSQYLAKTKRQ